MLKITQYVQGRRWNFESGTDTETVAVTLEC